MWGIVENICFFGRLFVGRLNAEKSDDHQRRNFLYIKPLKP